jgi:MFS family permease
MALSKNIRWLYVIKISQWFMVMMPVIVLFYQHNGLTLSQVFILQAVYSITTFAFEVPSGYVADSWGRRNSIIIGSIFTFTAYVIYSFSYGFWAFMLAEIAGGIGLSFVSGADTALLYDSLLAQNKGGDYIKQEGRITSSGNFAEAFAGIIGGFLAVYSLRLPVLMQALAIFVAIPAAFALTEPPVPNQTRKPGVADILRITKQTLFVNKHLRNTILFSSVLGASTLTMAWMVQPYFKLVNVPLGWYGILWTSLNLGAGLTSLIAYRIERNVTPASLIVIFILIEAGGFLVPGFVASYGVIALIGIFYLMRGVANPVLKDYINRSTESDVRATVLSLRNLMIRLLFAIIGPFIGYMNDVINLQMAFVFSASLFLLLTLIFGSILIGSFKINTFSKV